LSATQLAQRVEARVGRILFASANEADVFVDGYVRPSASSGWDVMLDVSDPDGRVLGKRDMHFDGPACTAIDEGVALVIAVTLYPNTGLVDAGIPLDESTAGSLDSLFGNEPTDPDPSSFPARPTPAVGASVPHAPGARAETTASSARNRTQADGWGLALDGAGVAGFGQLPGASLGLSAHAQLIPTGAWPIELGATAFLARTANAGRGIAGTVRFELVLASLMVCPWQPEWLLGLSLCAGAEVGRLHVEPSDFAVLPGPSSDLVANLLGSGVLRVRLVGGLYLRAGLLLALPLVQRRYEYQTPVATTAQLYRMPQVAGRAEIGLGWRF
jgi:hypothetical protein